jgi:hypothetical protein
MALVFDDRNIQIKFFSNKTMDSNLKKELIVYPVLAHKIYAPVIDDLELNIFQKYILSILNKGNFSLDEISEWLSLDIILVTTIAVELANKGLIDINTMIITEKGKEITEGTFSWFNNAESLKKDIRYVFQDVFTQELYPVVLPFDNFQENVWLEKGQLIIGTKGKKDSFHYELIKPKNINLNKIRKPETEEILDALNKHIKKYAPDSKNDIKEVPNAISYLDEEPDLFYCAIWIFSEQNNKQEENIAVLDPFNIHDDTYWLISNVIKAKKQNDTLKDVIHNLVYNIEEEEKKKVSEYMLLFDKDLDKELGQAFDFTLKTEFPTLYSAVKEYYFDIKFYELHNDSTHLKNGFRKSQIVLETLFKEIYNRYKDDYEDVINSQTYNGGRFHAYKDEIVTKIKTINEDAQIPNWYHKEFRNVYNALKNPDRASLRALFIASVLASFYNHEIPIYNILNEKNNTAICIENIAENRNKVGHKYVEISDKEIDKYFDDAKAMQKEIKEIIRIFLKNY